jgi:hypothetical protein
MKAFRNPHGTRLRAGPHHTNGGGLMAQTRICCEKRRCSGGQSLDPKASVTSNLDPQASPCPFCRAGTLLLIGGTRRFLYYQCEACTEVWTVTSFPPKKSSLRHDLIRAN